MGSSHSILCEEVAFGAIRAGKQPKHAHAAQSRKVGYRFLRVWRQDLWRTLSSQHSIGFFHLVFALALWLSPGPAQSAAVDPQGSKYLTERTATATAASVAVTAKPEECSVVLYGDSILHGGFLGNQRLAEPPSALLQRLRPRFKVQDLTRNGESATQRADQFRDEVRTAKYVVIQYGINDAIQSLPFERPLRLMVETARKEGRFVIVTGLSRQLLEVPLRVQYDATARQVALQTKSTFADWGAVQIKRDDMADALHPAKSYSDQLTLKIVNALDRLAPGCKKKR